MFIVTFFVMIIAESLSKKFPGRLAVDQVSFEVGKGEIVGFLGPNGAGKTTTLRMLTGFLPPSSGSAKIAGFDIVKQSMEARKVIGYMPENVPLYPDMRVREYLRFRAQLRGIRGQKLKDRLGETMQQCGLWERRRSIIGGLSKGYKQRVGLADALLHEPELLILDEPTNGLDPNQIRQVRDLIRNLSKDRTVLLSTHILGEVEMLCDRVIILREGQVRAIDSPLSLVRQIRTAGRIETEINGPFDQIRDALRQLDTVRKVTGREIEPGWNRFQLRVEAGTEARLRIFRLCQEYNWKLRELHREEARLEDAFVELTHPDETAASSIS